MCVRETETRIRQNLQDAFVLHLTSGYSCKKMHLVVPSPVTVGTVNHNQKGLKPSTYFLGKWGVCEGEHDTKTF